MNTSYILILWLSLLNSPTANTDGALTTIEFRDVDSCIYALQETVKRAKYINGVCVPYVKHLKE